MRKLLILDVDGTLTDGAPIYGLEGTPIAKRFNDQDFTAIEQFKAIGWAVCWLSAGVTVSPKLAEKRGIDYWLARKEDGSINKAEWIYKLSAHYQIPVSNMIYVGDDLPDRAAMLLVQSQGGLCYCPSNAAMAIREVARTLERRGGDGVVAELGRWFLPGGDQAPVSPQQIEEFSTIDH
jgi:3-deoxy-D-manno-octulosonate 8-phosphate phosphatase (KDO 8-P phosphatase)